MMVQVIPASWLNKVLLITSILCVIFCLIIELWVGLTPFSIYVLLTFCIIIITGSTWYSFFLLKMSLKANSPMNLTLIQKLLFKRLRIDGAIKKTLTEYDNTKYNDSKINMKYNENDTENISENLDDFSNSLDLYLSKIISEINVTYIDSWYKTISDDNAFIDESNVILKKLLKNIHAKITVIDKARLLHKMADVLLLHLKEYRYALRRVQKERAKSIEEAYRYSHPGSRNSRTLEHVIHRLVTIMACEFLQWELTHSLPCKLLLSIVAKNFLSILQDISCPHRIFSQIIILLQTSEETLKSQDAKNDIVLQDSNTESNSATATVITQPLPQLSQSVSNDSPIIEITIPKDAVEPKNTNRVSLCLDGLSTINHNNLWKDLNDEELYDKNENDRISPVYEEPTDFATTIARLRNVLEEKSTITSPLSVEEKFFTLCDTDQFVNLVIPWTEFTTSIDGSQQLLYCIQFDDVEQHGEDMFETVTATVRRQYVEFVQLHKSLEESPNYTAIMSNIYLPEGGRLEMETYLKTLCSQLSPQTPPQLRRFLRPSNEVGKKADAVAPRFDKFLAKTVTGVLNTLRTVIPGFEIDQEEDTTPIPTLMPLSDIPWRFVEGPKTKNITDKIRKLISEKVDYCSVDTAYEVVESAEDSEDAELFLHWWKTRNRLDDEELDELDSKLTMTCACIDIICEILAGIESNNTFRHEVVIRWTKICIGNITEPLIYQYTSQIFQHVDQFCIFSQTSNESNDSIEVLKDKLFNILYSKVRSDIKFIFGENDIKKIIKFLIESIETKQVNLDLILQVVDVFASELLAVCKNEHGNSVI